MPSNVIFAFGRDMLIAALVLSLVLHLVLTRKGARIAVILGFALPAFTLALGIGPALWALNPVVVIVLYLAGALLALIGSLVGGAAAIALQRWFKPTP